MSTLATVGVGILVSIIIEALKRLRGIPINAGDTAKIRVTAGVLSVIGAVGLQIATGGDLSDQFLEVTGESITAYLMAGLSYFSFFRKS